MVHRLSTYVVKIKHTQSRCFVCHVCRALLAMLRAIKIIAITLCMIVGLFVSNLTAAAEETIAFDIARQSAGEALPVFGQQADITVIYQYDQVKPYTTNALSGNYSMAEALAALLKDTGLNASFNGSHHLIITIDNVQESYAMSSKQVGQKKNVLAGILGVLAGSGVATAGAEQPRMLEEVIVTAQKRAESVQDVGAAITALGGERLVDAGVNNIQDLGTMSPGLTLGESFGFAQIMIRGVGTDNPFAGGDPSVAMHVDGVVTGQSSAQLGSLFDISRVEVLRGPQGTLYGRNTTGGSINVITNDPTEELSGYARFTGGSYDLLQFEGAVANSLSDNLLGRIAVKIVDRGGYGEDIATGKDIDDAQQESVRVKLKWLINDSMDLMVQAERHQEDDRNYMPKYRSDSYDISTINATNFPDASAGALAAAQAGLVSRFASNGLGAPDPRDISSGIDLQNEREQNSYTATFNWAINDMFSLVSISNYQDFEKIPQQDFDFTSENFYIQSERVESEQYSEELQLHFTGDSYNGLVGLFYYNDEILADNRLHQTIPVPPCAAGGFTNIIDGFDPAGLCFNFYGTAEAEAAGLFTNVNFDLSEAWRLTLGGRYSYENRKGDTTHWHAPASPILTFQDEKSFNDFTPSVRLEWAGVEDVLVYASYTEGFKSGIFLAGQRNPVLEPENMKAYEIGMKGQFLDNRLQVNTAAFFYDYTNLQQGRSVPAGATGFTLVYDNAAGAEVKGAEMEITWLASDVLRIDASATYLDATFTDYISTDPFNTVYSLYNLYGDGVSAPDSDLSGNTMVQSPEWAYTLRAQIDFPEFDNGWYGQLVFEGAYKDKIYFSQFNHESISQDSVTTYNANLKFTSPDDKWSVNLWGKNLTDEAVYTGMFIINGSRTNSGMLAPPRTAGATLAYNF